MHELSLMEGILKDVLGDLQARGITDPAAVEEVHLRIGALEIHSSESFRQAFVVSARETPLARARLLLEVVPATLACPQCGYSGALGEDEADGHQELPVAECPRCGQVSAVQGGRGVGPIELVLA